ncbi:MAG: phosphoribosyltransferase family protein, partial [Candidatus Amoebophilus sp.]
SIQVTGTVKNTHAIIIDDIIDTGHTLYAVAQELRKQGACSVYALCTHPIFSGYAYDCLLRSSVLDKIIVTNTIPLKKQHVKIKVLDIAPCILPFIEKVVLEV